MLQLPEFRSTMLRSGRQKSDDISSNVCSLSGIAYSTEEERWLMIAESWKKGKRWLPIGESILELDKRALFYSIVDK